MSLRTTQLDVPEMLAGALRIVADAACSLELAKLLLSVDLVAVCYRRKATWDILRILGVVTVRLEESQRTLIWSESRQLDGRRITSSKLQTVSTKNATGGLHTTVCAAPVPFADRCSSGARSSASISGSASSDSSAAGFGGPGS